MTFSVPLRALILVSAAILPLALDLQGFLELWLALSVVVVVLPAQLESGAVITIKGRVSAASSFCMGVLSSSARCKDCKKGEYGLHRS